MRAAMRAARRPPRPDAPATVLPALRLRPRTRYRASGRRSQRRPVAARREVARDRSCRREPLPPARVRRAPPELALGLCVRGTAKLGHELHAALAGEQPPD